MPDADIIQRVRRIYAAIETAEEHDLCKLTAQVLQTGQRVSVLQDFSGGLRQEEFDNLAYSVIHNIANLHDHLRKWAAQIGGDKGRVDQAFKASLAVQVMKDLSNNDKHGYPPRGGGHTGRSPQLLNPRRVLSLSTGDKKGSSIALTFGPGGIPRTAGDGSAHAIVTGEVVDKDGEPIGDLHQLAQEAVERWEEVARGLGALE